MNTNSENPKVGKAFQEMVCKSVEDYFHNKLYKFIEKKFNFMCVHR